MAPDQAFAMALDHYQCGQLSEAEGVLNQLQRLHPGNPDVRHLLAVIALQTDRPGEAADHLKTAVDAVPGSVELFNLLGSALQQDGQLKEAFKALKKAVDLQPDLSESHYNLGNVEREMERFEESAASYRKAIALMPGFADAHFNLGLSLKALNRLDEAADAYRRVVKINLNDAEAHNNLGVIMKIQGDLKGAEESYKKALTIHPEYADANLNIGNIQEARNQHEAAAVSYSLAIQAAPNLREAHFGLGAVMHNLNKSEESLASWRRAIELDPDDPTAYANMSIVLRELGRFEEAFQASRQAIALAPKFLAFWREWVECVYQAPDIPLDDRLIRELETFLDLGSGGVEKLRSIAQNFISNDPSLQGLMQSANAGDISALAHQVVNGEGLGALSTPLFSRFISRSCVTLVQLETLLTAVRRIFLRLTLEQKLDYVISEKNGMVFLSALAKHCFLNEYVYMETAEETVQANALENAANEALASGAAVKETSLALLACYRPLADLENARALLERNEIPNNTPLKDVLAQQVQEPLEEREIRAQIPKLTEISDSISKDQRRRREQKPYPRWTDIGIFKADSMRENLCDAFPHLLEKKIGWSAAPQILVAGCGSGRQALQTARQYKDAKVLAVDPGLANLAYGERKRRERKIDNVEFKQADIIALGQLERRFNMIQCSGTPHMGDSLAEWRLLAGLLNPHGFMLVGLYSEHARKSIVKACAYIREKGYAPTPDDMRQCRSDIMSLAEGHPAKAVEKWPDFFTMPSFREMIFNVREHRFTLPQIAATLDALGLEFVGFNDLDRRISQDYRARFPDDKQMTGLDLWDAYERDNPDAFTGMRQFWAYKPG